MIHEAFLSQFCQLIHQKIRDKIQQNTHNYPEYLKKKGD